MPLINVVGVGVVQFPDGMSPQEIEQFVADEILPKYGPKKETPNALVAGARGLMRGIGELGILAGDTLPALGASALGAKGYAERQYKEAEESRAELEKKYPKAVESYKDVTFGNVLPYGAERLGEILPDILAVIGTGGVGALASASRAGLKQAATTAGKAASAAAAREAAEKATQAAATTGFRVGAGAGSYAQIAPEIAESVYRETGEMAPATALSFAVPAALLDTWAPTGIVSKLGLFGTFKAAEKSLADAGKLAAAKVMGMEAAKVAAKEGLTESAQESITIAAEQFQGSNKKFFDPSNIERLIESGISGAIGGGTLGAGTGYLQRRADIRAKEGERVEEERKKLEEYYKTLEQTKQQELSAKAAKPFTQLGEAAAGELDKVAAAQQAAEAKTAEEELAPTVSPITAYLKQQEELNKQRETQEQAQAAEQQKRDADIAAYEKEQAALEARGESERAALLKKQEAEAEAERVAQRKADVEAAIATQKQEQAAAKITPPPYTVPQVLDFEFLKSALPAGGPASVNAILKKLKGAVDLSDPAQYQKVKDALFNKMNELSDKRSVYRNQLEALSNAIETTYGAAANRTVQPEAGQPAGVAGVGAPVQPAGEPPVGRPESVGAGGVGTPEGATARDVSGPPAGEVAVEGFTTAKGSTYEVTPEGKTVRTKKSEGKGQGTTYPPHSALYVESPASTEILSDMQAGAMTPKGHAVRLGYLKDNKFNPVTDVADIPAGADPAVAVVDRNKNEIVSLQKAQLNPAVGLHPVEKLYQPDGNASTHIGNKITKLKTKKSKVLPSKTTAADAEARLFQKLFGDLDEETKDLIIGGDVKDALERLVKTTQSDTVRLIAQRLLAQPDFLPTIQISASYFSKISHPERKRWVGVYQPKQHHVILKYPSGLNEHTFIHELLHAYVYRIIDSPNLTQTQRTAVNNLKEIYEDIKTRPEFKGEYGLTNIHEFISEAFSNPKFQQKLKQVKTSKVPTAPSLWTKFTRAVAALFGLDNALGRTMKEVDDLLTATPTLPPSRYAQAAPLAHALTAEQLDLIGAYPSGREGGFANQVEQAIAAPNLYATEKVLAGKVKFSNNVAGLQYVLKDLPYYVGGMLRGDILIINAKKAHALAIASFRQGPMVFQDGALVVTDGPSPAKARQTVVDAAKQDKMDVAQRLKLFDAFMKARRAQSLRAEYDQNQADADLVLNNPNASAEAKKTAQKLKDKPLVKSGLTDQQVQNALKLANTYPDFQQAADMYQAYNEAMVQVYLQAGLITPDKADTWLNNVSYVPFFRVMEEEQRPGHIPSLTGAMEGLPTFKKLKGSEQKVNDIFENMLANTMFAARIASANMASRVAISQLQGLGLARKVDSGGNVQLYEDGKVSHFQIDDDSLSILPAFEGVNANAPEFLKVIGAPTRILSRMYALNPFVQFRQIFKEVFNIWVQTGYQGAPALFKTLKDYFTSISKGPTEDQLALIKRGAVTTVDYTGSDEDIRRAIRADATSPSWFANIVAALEKNAILADSAARAQVYRKYLDEGDTEAIAAYKASQTLDHSLRGTSSAITVARHFTPFINSQIQSLTVLIQAARGTGPMSREDRIHIQRKFYQRGLTIAALTVLYTIAMSDDEDYLNAKGAARDNFWFFPGVGPNNEPLRIPIMFEVGMIFKTIPERLTMLALGQDTTGQFRDSMIRIVKQMFLANPVPQGMLPFLETTTNHSIFRDAPIVGNWLAEKEPAAQYSHYTSETAKALGALLNYSPLKIDYLVQAYFSQIGAFALLATDAIVGTMGEPPSTAKPTKNFAQLPIFNLFFQSTDDTAEQEEFYKLSKEIHSIVQTHNKYKREEPKKALEYQEEKQNLLLMAPVINNIEKQLKLLRDRESRILASDLTADQKRDELNEIKRQRNAFASRRREIEAAIGRR